MLGTAVVLAVHLPLRPVGRLIPVAIVAITAKLSPYDAVHMDGHS